MPKYVKKRIPVEAIELTHQVLEDAYNKNEKLFDNAIVLREKSFSGTAGALTEVFKYSVIIKTKEGNMSAEEGAWLVQGQPYKEVWAVQPDIFAATYEEYVEPIDLTKVKEHATNLGVATGEIVDQLADRFLKAIS